MTHLYQLKEKARISQHPLNVESLVWAKFVSRIDSEEAGQLSSSSDDTKSAKSLVAASKKSKEEKAEAAARARDERAKKSVSD